MIVNGNFHGRLPKVIAVKTVEKFHTVRLPLLKEFWTNDSAVEVLYLSNTGGDPIPGCQPGGVFAHWVVLVPYVLMFI